MYLLVLDIAIGVKTDSTVGVGQVRVIVTGIVIGSVIGSVTAYPDYHQIAGPGSDRRLFGVFM